MSMEDGDGDGDGDGGGGGYGLMKIVLYCIGNCIGDGDGPSVKFSQEDGAVTTRRGDDRFGLVELHIIH